MDRRYQRRVPRWSHLQFRFGRESLDFEVLELTPGTRVRWKCVAGAQEWIDTRIQFDINSQEGETVLRFKHCAWREEVERAARMAP